MDSNTGPLVSEVTVLSTVPQPLPNCANNLQESWIKMLQI